MSTSLYELIEVPATASEDTIRQALTQKQRFWSKRSSNAPSLEARQEAERKMAELKEAQRILLDPQARQAYDAQRRGGSSVVPPAPAPQFPPPPQFPQQQSPQQQSPQQQFPPQPQYLPPPQQSQAPPAYPWQQSQPPLPPQQSQPPPPAPAPPIWPQPQYQPPQQPASPPGPARQPGAPGASQLDLLGQQLGEWLRNLGNQSAARSSTPKPPGRARANWRLWAGVFCVVGGLASLVSSKGSPASPGAAAVAFILAAVFIYWARKRSSGW